jgi:DNA-binding response OmpR family regulator
MLRGALVTQDPRTLGVDPRLGSNVVAGSSRVLIVDDDLRLHELLTSYLVQNGFDVVRALDGLSGLAKLENDTFDAVLLDVMMPGIDGLEVCRRIRRKSDVPILMLTARGDETDRIVGLELGADDYLPTPFNPRELLARLRAILRRVRPEGESERIVVGALAVDMSARRATFGDKLLDLTGIEFDILAALARRAGQVIPRDRLLSAAGRGDVVVSERTIDVHISHVRQKLGDGSLIKTVRGVGYVLAKESSTEPPPSERKA